MLAPKRNQIPVSETNETNGLKAPETPITELNQEHQRTESISDGHVLKAPELLVATPIDALFLILPAFLTRSTKSPVLNTLFLSTDDLLEGLCETSKHLKHTLGHENIRQTMEARIIMVCDMVEAGDEKMYRLNMDKLLGELLSKAKRTVASGLPATIEEKFVRKALEAPTMALKREESSQNAKPDQEDIAPQSSLAHTQSQSTVATPITLSASSTGTDITIPDVPEEKNLPTHLYLLRLRTALSYMTSAYLPSLLAGAITTKLSSPDSPIDFTPLDKHLAHVVSLKAEALASRSLSDYSRKRNMYEDDGGGAESRAEKKRRREEEEKRKKAGVSRGVRDLKKADVSGMRKMSDFFGKRPGKK